MTDQGGDLEVFLDETPGETRGVVMRGGRFTHLLIARETDIPQHRLGARATGRVREVSGGLRGAFVDLGTNLDAFLPLGRSDRATQGERIEVVVTAEPREAKGAVVRRTGAGEGAPRLLESAPDVSTQLRLLAPGTAPATGVAAIDAAVEAEEEALARQFAFPVLGLDLAVERTRALIAVDIDHAPTAGRDPKQARDRANREGLAQSARLIRLKRWGGLVAIDLAGGGQDGEVALKAARTAFARTDVGFGPVSRFGLLQVSIPWTRTPIEEVLHDAEGRRSAETRALDLVRRLRRSLLVETRAARITARCAPQDAALAAPLAARLGPRAVVVADPGVAIGQGRIEEE